MASEEFIRVSKKVAEVCNAENLAGLGFERLSLIAHQNLQHFADASNDIVRVSIVIDENTIRIDPSWIPLWCFPGGHARLIHKHSGTTSGDRRKSRQSG